MKYRKLGRTKLKVSVIGFGGGPLQVVPPIKANSLIHYSIDKGINIIDIDKVHKDNETKVGNALISRRDKMYIMAKSFETTKLMMDKAIKESLRNLKTDYIDIYQMHLVKDIKDLNKRLNGSFISLKKARSEGIINFIGISGHHIPTLIEAIKTNKFDTALIPYNIGHVIAGEKLFETAKSYGVGIITMKSLGGGFLIDPKFPDEKPFDTARYMTAKNALSFVLSKKNISCTLVGFNEKEHIDEAVNVGNKRINLTQKQINSMNNKVLEFLGEDYCRNCKYCIPCEGTNGKLEIDKILRLEAYYSKYGYRVAPKEQYAQLDVKADACINCKRCIPKCPYNINIPQRLRKAHETLKITRSDLKEIIIKKFENYNIRELKEKLIENKVIIEKYRDRISKLNEELNKKNNELGNKENELYNIYKSITYRFFISKIWKIHNIIKKILR